MTDVITEHIDIWTSAIVTKKSVGRGSGKKQEAYGIKKLRGLILELAVRGKLVPQDSNDEPASVLLEKIIVEREQLIKDKKIKKLKKFKDIQKNEKPFLIPDNWEFVRLNDIGEWGAGATPTRGNHKYYGGTIPWFKSGELNADYISKSEEHITELALAESSVRYNKVGDVLIAMYGATIGKTAILEVPATTNQAVCACTPFGGFSNIFLLMLLKAYRDRFINMGAGGAQPNISREKIIATVIPLPPLEEQHRIVAKVDELMALCDKLEEEQEENGATHQILVETLLNTLTNVETPEAFTQSRQRIAGHFDVLFTTEKSIDKLQETILQLAVMGKLVAQDLDDEPASVLLEKIAEEKERLVKEGEIKKQKKLPEINDEEKLYILPKGWEWTRLINYYDVRDGTHDSPKTQLTGYPLITSKNLYTGKLDLSNVKYISSEDYLKINERSKVDKGDILFAMIGSIGNPVIVDIDDEFSIKNVALFKYYLSDLVVPRYLQVFLKIASTEMKEKAAGGVQAFVSLGKLRAHVMPIPPLKEQYRIVAKVDELMALCDSLKLALREAKTTQAYLADTVAKKIVG